MGGPGSGGHNAKPLAAHVLAGTWRPDRHGKVVDLPRAAAGPPPVAPAGLSEAAVATWDALMAEYSGWAPHELRLLELALRAADRAAACRRRIAKDGLVVNKRANPLIRVQRSEERFMLDVFRQLRLDR